MDVIPITERNGSLQFGGPGTPVEYAVLMKRLDETRFLSYLLEHGRISGEMVDRVAYKIAAFHATAATSEEITKIGGAEAVKFNTYVRKRIYVDDAVQTSDRSVYCPFHLL